MDPSEKLSKVRLPEIRGRARSRPASENGQWRSRSGDAGESLASHRIFMQKRLLGETSGKYRRIRSQIRYQAVASVIHLDNPRVDYWEEDTTIPGLIWRWKMLNTTTRYQYKPLQECTDFRLLHVLPAANSEGIVHCGFTRHNSRAVRRRFFPFVFVEDTTAFYGDRSALIMLNGLPFFVTIAQEAMLKRIRRSDNGLLLFNRSICIGEDYRVYESSSKRWNAEELENEVRQLCTLRRLRDLNLRLGVVLTWSEALGFSIKDHRQYDIDSFAVVEPSVKSTVELAPAYQTWERSEKPAAGARKDSYLRGRWSHWTGEDGQRPWARQLRCRTRSADSGPSSIEPFKYRKVLPPSEAPFRRSRSEQRGYEAIGWRGQEVDMDAFWDGLFFTHPSVNDFLWKCRPLPLASDLPFNHSAIDYDKEIVLARVLDDGDKTGSTLRFGLLRFRWDRIPQCIFIANSMAFNPYAQATVQINGQFARISRSLEVCLRSLRTAKLSILIFAWPVCVPLHRMIDTSWVDAIFCTLYKKAASIIDAQGHLANLSAHELDSCIRASNVTSNMYKRHVNAWKASKREIFRAQMEEEQEWESDSSDGLSSPLEEARNDPVQRQSESISEEGEETNTDSETGSLPPAVHWHESIWKDDRDIPTIAFRDFDRASKTGRLAHVRDAFGGIYCPLDPVSGDVRLVAVMPEDPQAPSQLELQIECREMNWGYIALSYCWGNADDQQGIIVNGNAVSVRRNLYDFLVYYREAPLSKEGRGDAGRFTLWIDALSINQSDKREKAREVRRMNRLYEEADFVLVWIGLRAANLPFDVAALLEDAQANESELRQVAEVLVGNPYFFRAWCTQELAVNSQVYICIGTCWLSWMKFVKLVQVAFMPAALQSIDRLKDSSDDGRNMVWLLHSGSAMMRFDIISWLRYRLHCKAPPTLLSLLAATSHCDCSVKSDQIYSLWALASDAYTLLSDVDYLKPAKDVFQDFARSWMLKYKRCDILTFVELPDLSCPFDAMGLQGANPSWVPDWSLRRSTWPLLATWTLPTTAFEVDLEVDDIEWQWLYGASGRTPANVKFLNTANGLGLLTAGIRADTLVEVLDKFSGLPDIFRWHETCLSWLESIRRHFKSSQREDTNGPGEGDLLDALVAGRYYDGTKRTAYDSSYLALGHPGDHILVVNKADGKVDVERFDTDDNVWVTHVMRITAGRRLAITRTGHVGLVPGSAEVGDEVVVVFGCSMPLLFRREEKSKARRVIGECYFERMMDGQVVDAAGDVEIPDTGLSSILAENEASGSMTGSLENMESLSELLPEPCDDDRPQPQWFFIV